MAGPAETDGALRRARLRLVLAMGGVLALLAAMAYWLDSGATTPSMGADALRLQQAWRAPGPWPAGASNGPPPPGQWVALPDVWRRQTPKLGGVHHYVLSLPPPRWQGPSALYLPRLGNRARLWLDGQLLAEFGQLQGGHQDYSPRPLLVAVPDAAPGQLDRTRQLVVEVAGTANRFSGLSHLGWGPAGALEREHAARDTLLLAGAGLAGGGSLLLGTMGLALAAWRRNTMLVFFGLAGLAAGTRALLWMWRDPPVHHVAWYTAMDACFGLWACSIAWFALRAVDIRHPLLEWALRGLVLLMVPSTAMAALGLGTVPKETWLDLTLLVAAAITLALVRRAWQRPDGVATSLALGAVTVVTLSGVDHWNIFFSTAPDAYVRPYFSHHMALLFGLFMTASLAARFDAAVKAEGRLRDDLAQQVQAQREELLALHQREQARHAALAAQRERHRIMQDMHDGLGAHLTGLLALAERGALDSRQVAQEVAEAIDHLRLAVDSANQDQASLSDVLAQVRFRLSPRLAKLGLAVDWRLDDTPGLLNPEQASHVQKIVLEALSNTLRHAQARRWQVHTGVHGGQTQLVLEDDGTGLPQDGLPTTGGNGLRHMQARARALGTTLHFERPAQGGLRLRLCWPPQG